jgi:hypothetical protein
MKSIEFLNNVAEKINFKRQKYDDSNSPTDLDDILVISYFGDIKHTCILSEFILNNFKKLKNSKYLILISYPGFEHLFPYIDEYWSPSDLSNINQIFLNSEYFENKSKFYIDLTRNLNENFRNVMTADSFKEFYYNKFTDKFWESFNFETNFFLPMIASSSVLPKETIKTINLNNSKVFIHPSQTINVWSNGKYNKVLINKNFYIELIKYLKENKIFPVIWNNNFSYDLSSEFKEQIDCLTINSNNMFEILPAIRMTGLCLDIFNDISKFSNIARTPSLIFEERNKYFLSKEYELDDILNLGLPGKRLFALSNTIIRGNKSYWEREIFNPIKSYCDEYLPYIDKESLPNTSEINKKMDISLIRKLKNIKLGTKFIKIEKLI